MSMLRKAGSGKQSLRRLRGPRRPNLDDAISAENKPMKNFTLLSSLFLTLGIAASPTIAQNNLPPEVREMARKVMMPVVYKVPGMNKVQVVQNLKYTDSDDPNILMDIYLPPDLAKAEKRPVVIF